MSKNCHNEVQSFDHGEHRVGILLPGFPISCSLLISFCDSAGYLVLGAKKQGAHGADHKAY